MDDFRFAWPFLIPIVAIVGAFSYAIVQTLARARVRELEVRERIAMIERGLVPAPEVDPRGFDRAMSRLERREIGHGHRHRSAGVTLMGVGFGLMVLIAFTADTSIAIGVGGFLVVIGIAFFINSRFEQLRNGYPPTGPYAGVYPPAAPQSTSTPPPGSTLQDPARHD
jgi:hypothetical protein